MTTLGDRQNPCALVVMGVSGSGKSTIADRLAIRIGWRYEDGDGFHPPSNVAKMHSGQPLTDEDRWPWLRAIAAEMGFQRCGIAGIELGEDEAHLRDWLAQGLYGTMDWMARHGDLRARPAELLPGTVRVISVGLDYGRNDDDSAWTTLADADEVTIREAALADEKIAALLDGEPRKVIVVPGRMVNVVP